MILSVGEMKQPAGRKATKGDGKMKWHARLQHVHQLQKLTIAKAPWNPGFCSPFSFTQSTGKEAFNVIYCSYN